MSPRSSFRVAAVVTTLGALGLVAGCSAAPMGAEDGTDAVRGNASQDQARGTIAVPGLLSSETTGETPGACNETGVAIPSALSGCTYGALYAEDPLDRFYAWACPASVQLPTSAFGLAPSAKWYETVTITTDPTVGFACFGDPVAPEVLVVDEVAYDPSHIKGFCPGACF